MKRRSNQSSRFTAALTPRDLDLQPWALLALKHQVSHAQLAQLIAIPARRVRLAARAGSNPRLADARAIAAYFKLSLDDAFATGDDALATGGHDAR